MRVVYANCPVPSHVRGDLLVTDEPLVADSWRGEVRVADVRIDPANAHTWSIRLWDRAFDWFRARDGSDPTVIDGISAGDLAAFEVALTVLLPAGRAALACRAAASELAVDELAIVTPAAGDGNHVRIERVAAEVAALVLGAPVVERVAAQQDPRLLAKFRRTRDPDWLAPGRRGRRALRAAVLGAANAHFALRRRPSLYVLEYPPTRAFAREYARRPARKLALVRAHPLVAELGEIARAGDRAVIPAEPALDHQVAHVPLARDAFEIDGVDVWPAIAGPLAEVVNRHARYIAESAGAVRHELRRSRVQAVLVPFDGPPRARLLVRVAQGLGLPTLVLSDGFKADEVGREGMAADVALAWSELTRDHYFSRRADRTATVTGNPRATKVPQSGRATLPPRRILVGGFTFSPQDLNCRRSDPERFTTEVLEGVAQGAPDVPVTLKLHPADEPEHYAGLIGDDAAVEVVATGDVLDLFALCDVYITTYSTSLVEAAAAGLPVVYYRVNPQRIGPPFDGDPWLERRTAQTPAELAALLRDSERLREPLPPGWLDRVLGPQDGRATERICRAVEAQLDRTG